MAHYSRVKPFRRRSTGCQRAADAREADWLIAECREHFLVGEKPLASVVEHQYGLAPPEREKMQVFARFRRGCGDAPKPDLETTTDTRRAPNVHCAAMLADDLAHSREPQATTGQARGKKRFEDALDGDLVHTPPGVVYRDTHIAARPELTMGTQSRSRDVVHLRLDFDGSPLIHRLGSVAAKIENHLLQLSGLTGYDGCVRHFAYHQFDPRRQRSMKQGARLGDQSLHVYRPALHIPGPAESEDPINKIARALSGTADLAKVVRRPAVGRQLCFRHFRIAEDCPDDIVEVVRDTAGESTDRLHTAGLLQASL